MNDRLPANWLCAFASMATIAFAAQAADYPERPIRLVRNNVATTGLNLVAVESRRQGWPSRQRFLALGLKLFVVLNVAVVIGEDDGVG